MDNALAAQRTLELAPGVALNKNQINRLTRDIVWLEEMQVEGQAVLVPKVSRSGDLAEARNILKEAGTPSDLQLWAMVETPAAAIMASTSPSRGWATWAATCVLSSTKPGPS